jgi:putative FmdB family regulatory protein
VPVYEFRCATCRVVFDDRRPMAEADAPATCPEGHVGATRLLPVFATTGLASAPLGADVCGAPAPGGCGAGCACC